LGWYEPNFFNTIEPLINECLNSINLIEIEKIFIETDLKLEKISDYYNQCVYIDESSEDEIPYHNEPQYDYLENYYEEEKSEDTECIII